MIAFSRLRSALAEKLKLRPVNADVRRGNEFHLRIERAAVLDLAKFLRSDFRAELMLMVANDRSGDASGFELHYLFANSQENWFVHATADLPAKEPTIQTLARF
jgi:NADH:ubiquinone oxidoreductase subunit C